MNEALDIAWKNILVVMGAVVTMLNRILEPLNQTLGPATVIFLLVVLLVCLTKWLSAIYTTRRHVELKENYEHWFGLRRQALAGEDREKGKALAKNIDQAQLNKAYYDYFFEGFLKSILTSILPILLTAAYINNAYTPENLMRQFGRDYIFRFSRSGGEPLVISAFFWFVISLFVAHGIWFTVGTVIKRKTNLRKDPGSGPKTEGTTADDPR